MGVAVEGGRCALCIVLGEHQATLGKVRPGEADEGAWVVLGVAAPGVPVAELRGRLVGEEDGAEGPWVAANARDAGGARPQDFELALPIGGEAQPVTLELGRRERAGIRRRLR